MQWTVQVIVALLNIVWIVFFLQEDPFSVSVQRRSSDGFDEEMLFGEFCIQLQSDMNWTSTLHSVNITSDKTNNTSTRAEDAAPATPQSVSPNSTQHSKKREEDAAPATPPSVSPNSTQHSKKREEDAAPATPPSVSPNSTQHSTKREEDAASASATPSPPPSTPTQHPTEGEEGSADHPLTDRLHLAQSDADAAPTTPPSVSPNSTQHSPKREEGRFRSHSTGSYVYCCLGYVHGMKASAKKSIESYRIQETDGECNIRAVVFLMKKRPQHTRQRSICANPDQAWVQQLIVSLDRRRIRK